MASEQGVHVDEAAFRALMEEQKERARADARAKKTGHTDVPVSYTHLDVYKRQLFEWDDARHRLTIHGADGDLDSIPVRRKILARTYGHGIDTQLTDLGFIETGTGAVFDIEPKLMSEEVKRSEQIRRDVYKRQVFNG